MRMQLLKHLTNKDMQYYDHIADHNAQRERETRLARKYSQKPVNSFRTRKTVPNGPNWGNLIIFIACAIGMFAMLGLVGWVVLHFIPHH